MMKKRLFSLAVLLTLTACLFAGCTGAGPAGSVQSNLTVINDSGAAVRTVSVSYKTGTGIASSVFGQNADNSALEKGDSLSFDFPETDGLCVLVTAYAGVGQKLGDPLVAEELTLDLACGKTLSFAIREGAGGALSIEPLDASA